MENNRFVRCGFQTHADGDATFYVQDGDDAWGQKSMRVPSGLLEAYVAIAVSRGQAACHGRFPRGEADSDRDK